MASGLTCGTRQEDHSASSPFPDALPLLSLFCFCLQLSPSGWESSPAAGGKNPLESLRSASLERLDWARERWDDTSTPHPITHKVCTSCFWEERAQVQSGDDRFAWVQPLKTDPGTAQEEMNVLLMSIQLVKVWLSFAELFFNHRWIFQIS